MRPVREVERYLDAVCARIENRFRAPALRRELRAHLEDAVSDLVAEGWETASAVEEACRRLGDPDHLGQELNGVLPPARKTLIRMALVVSAVGLAALALASGAGAEQYMVAQGAAALIGVLLMAVASRIDHRRLGRYPWVFFGLNLLLYPGVFVTGLPWNRSLFLGRLVIDVPSLSLLLTLLGLAALLAQDREWSRLRNVATLALFIGTPVFLLWTLPAAGTATTVIIAGIVMAWMGGVSRPALAACAAGGLGVSAAAVLSKPYGYNRLLAFLRPDGDPMGTGYVYLRMQEAMQAGGWWGMGSHDKSLPHLPGQNGDLLLAGLIAHRGIVAAAITVAAVVLLVWALLRIFRTARSSYGALLALGIGSSLGFRSLYHTAMIMGLLPTTGIGMPFASYGETALVVDLIAVGLVMGDWGRRVEPGVR